MTKVLVLATSRKTRGGITSVVKAHEKGTQWKEYHCKWLETHRDGNLFIKLIYLFKALLCGAILIPHYQLVHIHLSEPPSAIRKIPFMWWAKLWRKKTIVHFHSFSTETTIYSQWAWVYKYHFGHADKVITLSEYWKKEVGRFLGDNDKVLIVYNPCPVVDNKNTENEKEASDAFLKNRHVILYAGTVTPRKGYADMIRAFASISTRHAEWMIAFAGNGEIEKGKKIAEELGIEEKTVFLGWCTGQKKERAFREATIFCLPSYAEGFPMAVLDAWAYGLPVITTPVGGIPDVAKDGENMLLFNPGDIDSLAECMERLINDESLRSKISDASKAFANYTFNIKTINCMIGNVYKQLLNETN